MKQNYRTISLFVFAPVVAMSMASLGLADDVNSIRMDRPLSAEEQALMGKSILCTYETITPEIAEVPDGVLPEPGSGFGLSWKQITDAGFAKQNPDAKLKVRYPTFTFSLEVWDNSSRLLGHWEKRNAFTEKNTINGEDGLRQNATWTVETLPNGDKQLNLYHDDVEESLSRNLPAKKFVFAADTMTMIRKNTMTSHGHSHTGPDGRSYSWYYHEVMTYTCKYPL